MMNAPLTPQDREILSAYLDGQLTETEQSRVRVLLERHPELREELEGLRRTRQVLRAAPRRRAPRNFTLTPAMARQVRPPSLWSRVGVPSFSFASALATLLFILSFFFRLTPLSTANLAPMMAAAPEAVQDRAEPAYGVPPPAPIINWQGSAPTGVAGGMGGGSGKAAAPTPAPQFATEATRISAPDQPLLASTPTPIIESQPRAAAQPTMAETSVAKAAPVTPPVPTGSNSDGMPVTNGPILGIAATEERGQMVVPTREERDAFFDQPEPEWEWGWVQAGLAGGALLSGLVAFILWRRSRR